MLINQITNTIPSLVSAMAYLKLLPMDEYGSFRIYSHSNYIICRPLHPISCRKALAYWEAWFYSYGFARALWLSTHLEIGESIGSSHPKSQNFHNPNICNASSRSFMSNNVASWDFTQPISSRSALMMTKSSTLPDEQWRVLFGRRKPHTTQALRDLHIPRARGLL